MLFCLSNAAERLCNELAFKFSRVFTSGRYASSLSESVDGFEDEEARESAAEVGDTRTEIR